MCSNPSHSELLRAMYCHRADSVDLSIYHDLMVHALFRCQGREVSCRMGSDERPIVPSADGFLALCFNEFQLGQLGCPRERAPELGRNADASGGKLIFTV